MKRKTVSQATAPALPRDTRAEAILEFVFNDEEEALGNEDFVLTHQREMPAVYGVLPSYRRIANLRVVRGRFFDEDDASRAAATCVLGEAARTNLFGSTDPIGQFLKINEQWFRVIGVVAPQLTQATARSRAPGSPGPRAIPAAACWRATRCPARPNSPARSRHLRFWWRSGACPSASAMPHCAIASKRAFV